MSSLAVPTHFKAMYFGLGSKFYTRKLGGENVKHLLFGTIRELTD
jgi:hypothetical protein